MEKKYSVLHNIVSNISSLDKLTANQQMILTIAAKKIGEWITTAGMCNAGGFGGRGLHFSLKRLKELGYIEVRPYTAEKGKGLSHRHSFTASEDFIRRLRA